MIKKILLLLLLGFSVLLPKTSFSQHYQKPKDCRVGEIPESSLEHSKSISKTRKANQNARLTIPANKPDTSAWKQEEIIIPVVVHVFGKQHNGLEITYDIVEDALRTTTEDFRGETADWSDGSVSSKFDGIKEKLNVTFKLAKIDPNGNPTTGVMFHPEKSGFGYHLNINAEIQKYAWDNYKYCNVYIQNDLYADGDTNNSGVAWYPNTYMSDNNVARIVYNGAFLGKNTSENFRSVFTHEFGHWLDLRHTFNGGCDDANDDDLVQDTPKVDKTHMGETDKNCKGEYTNWQNFMNYTSQYIMYTEGQAARMLDALDHSTRYPLWQEDNLIATGVADNIVFKPRLAISESSLEEHFNNDGQVIGQLEVWAKAGAGFSKTGTLAQGTDYSIDNLPLGLTAKLNVTSDSVLLVTFEGRAKNHQAADSDLININLMDGILKGDVSNYENKALQSIQINFKDDYTTYCIPSIQWATYAHIVGVNYKTINSVTAYDGYSNFTSSYVSNVKRGESFNLTVTTGKGGGVDDNESVIRLWIDWNQNFAFEENELIETHKYINTSMRADNTYEHSIPVSVPADVNMGKIGMRVMVHHYNSQKPNTGETSCGGIESGETEDYALNIISGNEPFEAKFSLNKNRLNLSESLYASDLSTAPESTPITNWEWTFEGGIPNTFVGQIPPAINYPEIGTYEVALKVTDQAGQEKTVKKAISTKLEYCTPSASYGGYGNIQKVTIASHEELTPQNLSYKNHFASTNIALEKGEKHNFSISVNKGNGGSNDKHRIIVWVDWNYNGAFESEELVYSKIYSNSELDASGNAIFSGSFIPPLDVKLRKLGLRVSLHFYNPDNTFEGLNPCGVIDSGEIRDFGLDIQEGTKTLLADFSVSSPSPSLGQGIQFYDRSSSVEGNNITSWEWEFPNGTPSSFVGKTPPLVKYADPGVYDVSLTVTDVNNEELTTTKTAYIDAKYRLCEPLSNWYGYSHVKKVKLGSIDNSSGNNDPYVNYMESHATQVEQGVVTPLEIHVNAGKLNAGDKIRLRTWVDWNQDGTLDESESIVHEVLEIKKTGEDFIYKTTLIPSLSTNLGRLGLRVMATYAGRLGRTQYGINACDKMDSGEVEDYTLDIQPATSPIIADFESDTAFVNTTGQTVNFSDKSFTTDGSIVAWLWEFPGATPSQSTDENPSGVTYNTTGMHDVKLTVTSSSGYTRTVTKTEYIDAAYRFCQNENGLLGYVYMKKIQIGDFVHESENTSSVNDYISSQVADFPRGLDFPIRIFTNMGKAPKGTTLKVKIYADWNKDAELDESTELVHEKRFLSEGEGEDFDFIFKLKSPTSLILNDTVGLRVVVSHQNSVYNACGKPYFGEIKDYGLRIVEDTPLTLVDFSANKIQIPTDVDIQFSDESVLPKTLSITKWKWEFPGANIETYEGQTPPAIHYSADGDYDVKLTIETSDGEEYVMLKEDYINVSYQTCDFSYVTDRYGVIKRVQFKTVDRVSDASSTKAVQDFKETHFAEVRRGDRFNLALVVNNGELTGNYSQRVAAWADWNYNGEFEASERVLNYTYLITGSDETINQEITIPQEAKYRLVPLRVVLQMDDREDPDPCSISYAGEVEQYGLRILSTEPLRLNFLTSDFSDLLINEAKTIEVDVTDGANLTWKVLKDGLEYRFDSGFAKSFRNVFTETGSYQVQVTAQMAGETKTVTSSTFDVNTSLSANITTDIPLTSVNALESRTFSTDVSGGDYEWKVFRKGELIRTETSESLTHTFSLNGLHKVSLKVQKDGQEATTETAEFSVTRLVNPVTVADIPELLVNGTHQLEVNNNLNGGRVDYTPVSNPAGIVSVDASGEITALKAGTTEITIIFPHNNSIYNKKEIKKTVTVSLNPQTITVDKSTVNLKVGETSSVTTTGNQTTLGYSSDSDAVATFVNGEITALTEGSTTVTVRAIANDVYASSEKTITVNVTRVDQTLGILPVSDLEVGDRTYLTVTGDQTSLTYTSSNELILTIDPIRHRITAIAEGDAYVIVTAVENATYNAASARVLIRVNAKAKENQILTISPVSDIEVGETVQVTVNGNKTDLTYASSNPDFATVDGNGLVTALAKGNVVITVTAESTDAYNEAVETVSFKVTDPVVTPEDQTLVISPIADIEVGETVQVTVNGNKTDLTYASSNPAFATVDGNGLVTALAKGNVVITVTAESTDAYNGATETVSFKVTGEVVNPGFEIGISSESDKILTGVNVEFEGTGLEAGDKVAWGIFLNDTEVSSGSENFISFTPESIGTLRVELSVTRGDVRKRTSLEGILVEELSVILIDVTKTTFETGESYVFAAGAYTEGATLEWRVIKDGNSIPLSNPNGTSLNYKFAQEGSYEVMLNASIKNVQRTVSSGILTVIDRTPNRVDQTLVITPVSDLDIEKTATLQVEGAKTALTYASSDDKIATVDASGIVTGISEGEVTITVTAEESDKYNVASEVVTVRVIEPIVVIPEDQTLVITSVPNLKIDETANLDVSGDMTSLTYASSDESVATVDLNGVVTAVAEGEVTITVTAERTEKYNEATVELTINVTSNSVLSTDDFNLIVQAYPNPGNGVFNLTLPANYKTGTVEVLSLIGSSIRTFELRKGSYDLSDQTPGIYYLRVTVDGRVKVLKLRIK